MNNKFLDYTGLSKYTEKLESFITSKLSGLVPSTRKVNGKALSSDITLSASDVGAQAAGSYVPTSRTVNDKALSSNITLSASDVSARPDTWTPTASDVGAVPTSRTVNGKALSSNITLSASDVGAIGQSMAGKSVKPASDSANVTAGTGAEIFNDYRTRTYSGTTNNGGNIASGKYSHAEGIGTTASGESAHTENLLTVASGNNSHSEGQNSIASGHYAHAEGNTTKATANGTHTEGVRTEANGLYSHAEGQRTVASGEDSHAEGQYSTTTAAHAHAEGNSTAAYGTASHSEGLHTIAYDANAHAEGYYTVSDGLLGSHAEGTSSIAITNRCYIPLASYSGATLTLKDDANYPSLSSDLSKITSGMEILIWNAQYDNSVCSSYTISSVDTTNKTITLTEDLPTSEFYVRHAIIPAIKANSYRAGSHAEGFGSVAIGSGSHAEGFGTVSIGLQCHTEGSGTIAISARDHAEGVASIAKGQASHAEGSHALANNYASHASGKYNKSMTSGANSTNKVGDVFVVGNGTETSLSNAFRITYAGDIYATKEYKSTGADYAEYFEWLDGNPDSEDRVGRFVTLEGNKLRLAKEGDYVLGVVSGQPCIIGNADEDWLGRWEHDDFNRFVKEYLVHHEVEINSGDVITDDIIERDGHYFKMETEVVDYPTNSWRYKANPNYDASQPYIERQDRKEWDAVGMVGVLSVLDDGTCQVNSYAKVSQDGVATTATRREDADTWRVIERVTDRIVKIIFYGK